MFTTSALSWDTRSSRLLELLGIRDPWRWDPYVVPKIRYGVNNLWFVITQKNPHGSNFTTFTTDVFSSGCIWRHQELIWVWEEVRGEKGPYYTCTAIIPFDPHTKDKGEGEWPWKEGLKKWGERKEKCVVRLAARTIRVVGQLLLKYIAAAHKKHRALMWKIGRVGGECIYKGRKKTTLKSSPLKK